MKSVTFLAPGATVAVGHKNNPCEKQPQMTCLGSGGQVICTLINFDFKSAPGSIMIRAINHKIKAPDGSLMSVYWKLFIDLYSICSKWEINFRILVRFIFRLSAIEKHYEYSLVALKKVKYCMLTVCTKRYVMLLTLYYCQ